MIGLAEQGDILVALNGLHHKKEVDALSIRGNLFDNRQIGCPHCQNLKYVKYGLDYCYNHQANRLQSAV